MKSSSVGNSVRVQIGGAGTGRLRQAPRILWGCLGSLEALGNLEPCESQGLLPDFHLEPMGAPFLRVFQLLPCLFVSAL